MINEAHVSRRCLAAGGNRRMTKVKVLVMEDAAGVRRLLVSLLLENTRVGRVFEARDAATVLTLMAAHQPQIAILDITVPPAPGLTEWRRCTEAHQASLSRYRRNHADQPCQRHLQSAMLACRRRFFL